MLTPLFKAVANGTLKRSFRQRRQQRELMRNGVLVVIGGIVLYSILPGLQLKRASDAVIREKVIAKQNYTEIQNLELEARQQDSAIADDRLKSCTDFIFSQKDTQRMASVSKGLRVVDPVTGAPFGDYSIICDVNGGTAEVKNGVLTNLKISRNPQRFLLVQQALRAKGLRIEAGNPNIRPANAQEAGQ